jgi:hypothetical protein
VEDTVESIAYRQAERTLDVQLKSLDELRARAGLLLGAASIVTTFLGTQALGMGRSVDAIAVAALVCFALVVIACVIIWLPRTWRFSVGSSVLLEDWTGPEAAGDVNDLKRFLAHRMDRALDGNSTALKWLYITFEVACLALAAEVLLWIIKLA